MTNSQCITSLISSVISIVGIITKSNFTLQEITTQFFIELRDFRSKLIVRLFVLSQNSLTLVSN
jgi:hypothetical protein